MRSTVFATLALVPACIGLWLLILQVVPRPVIEERWIAGIYNMKEANAAQVQGPKVVLIGGSGTHYSYSARVVAQATGLSAVNLGTHAGLGANYLLYRARQTLKPGDTAVVALEYSLVHQSRPSLVQAMYVPTGDPGYLIHAPWRDLPALLFGYPPSQVIRQAAAASLPWNSPLYRAETVDAWGDETVNTPENKQPYMREAVRSLPEIAITGRANPDAPAPSIVAFADWAKRNDIRLIQTWPVTRSREAYQTPRYALFFERYAETFRRLGFESLGNPLNYLVPEDEMLDSMYHADINGAQRASRALAHDLCRVLDCPTQRPSTPAL